MKEVDNQLSELIKKAIEVAEKTGEFAIEQAPQLLQEFYNWHIFSHCMSILFAVLIFLIGRYLPYTWLHKESTGKFSVKFFKMYNKQDCDIVQDISASWVLFGCCSLMSFILLVKNFYNLMFILLAPKLYLIEYFLN